MTTPMVATPIDLATVEHLSKRFAEVFETLDAGKDVFSPDVFFDLNMPVWRFQLQGPEAFESQLKNIVQGHLRINVLCTVPTASGFVTEHQDVGGHVMRPAASGSARSREDESRRQ